MKKINRLINKSINKSEKFLALDVRYFSKNAFFIFLRQVFAGFSGFLVSFVLARQFSKYTFGEYNLTLSLLGMLSIFSFPGMMNAILDATARGFDKSLVEGTRQRFKTSFFSIPVFLLLSYFYFSQQKPTISLLLLLSLPIFPFFYTFKSYEVFLTAKENFLKLFCFASLTSVIAAGVVILNTLIFKKIYLSFLSLIFMSSLLDLFFYFQSKKDIKENAKIDPGMKGFARFLTLANLVSLIVDNLDKAILGFFTGFASIAVFSIANLLPQFVEKSLHSLQVVFVPKIIKQGKKGNLQTIKKHLIKIIFLSILISLLVFFTTPLFIKIFFGAKYQESIKFAQALSIPLVLFLASGILDKMITFQKRHKSILFFSFYPAVPKMVLYFLLIPRYGIWGLVLSLVASRILGFIGLLWVSLKND